MIIFTTQPLSSILVRKFSELDFNKKIFINTSEKSPCIKAENIEYCSLKTLNECRDFVLKNGISSVAVLSIAPAMEGLANYFKYNLNIPTIGVTKEWFRLEGSKLFAKEFMLYHKISTPLFMKIENAYEIKEAISAFGLPLIIKDDRLCSGFGTYICNSEKDCLKRTKKLLKENSFCIAEKYIKGKEVTLHHIWDGNSLISLEPVRDYKRFKANDAGINTGSMGAYMPVRLSVKEREMISEYTKKLESVFQTLKPDFKGIFVSGLMLTEDKLYTLEFNMRPGMPEFDVLTMHLNTNIFDVFNHIINGNCSSLKLEYKQGITGCVNVVHKDYEKHYRIPKKKTVNIQKVFLFPDNDKLQVNTYIEEFDNRQRAVIFNNSPILSVISNDINNPFIRIYKYLNKLNNKNLYYRDDLGNMK